MSALFKLDQVELSAKSVVLADGKTRPVWIQVAKPGVFKGHSAGPFTLDSRTFSDIVRNFRATSNRRVPIDFEHASEASATSGTVPHTGAPAQGWMTDFQERADGLYAQVEWLPLAAGYIKSGAYKFFSPAIIFDAKDRVTGKNIGARISSGALTNRPFIDGLQPLVARDDAARAAEMRTVTKTKNLSAAECSRLLSDAVTERVTNGQSYDESWSQVLVELAGVLKILGKGGSATLAAAKQALASDTIRPLPAPTRRPPRVDNPMSSLGERAKMIMLRDRCSFDDAFTRALKDSA